MGAHNAPVDQIEGDSSKPKIYERLLTSFQSAGMFSAVAERDTNKEAVRQVEKITDSEPVNSEELVESEDLKRGVGENFR